MPAHHCLLLELHLHPSWHLWHALHPTSTPKLGAAGVSSHQLHLLQVLSGAGMYSSYVGEGEARLRAAFARARAVAPATLFLDELDGFVGAPCVLASSAASLSSMCCVHASPCAHSCQDDQIVSQAQGQRKSQSTISV